MSLVGLLQTAALKSAAAAGISLNLMRFFDWEWTEC